MPNTKTKRFNSIEEVLADLRKKAENEQLPSMNYKDENEKALPRSSLTNGNEKSKNFSPSCNKCNDTGSIITRHEGKDYFKHCECFLKQIEQQRKNRAAIPEGFEKCQFNNFEIKTELQKNMIKHIISYIRKLPETKDTRQNSFGFIAELGEMEIRALPVEIRAERKREFNSFGLGKTHLAAAAAHKLLESGYRVKMINDVIFLNDLINAQLKKDSGETLEKLFEEAAEVDILIWDELGRSKPSENKQQLAYRIINERYLRKKPIIFTSNESTDGLDEKIGFAAVDRLIEMTGENLHRLKGESYRRLKK